MSITPQDTIAARRPSSGYSVSFAFACTAIAFIGVALEEGFGAGHTDTGSIFGQAGTIGLLFAFATGFAVRLVFWTRMSRDIQSLVRTAITAIFALSILMTMILAAICLYRLGSGAASAGMTAFTILSALCQIATIIWLVRYRAE